MHTLLSTLFAFMKWPDVDCGTPDCLTIGVSFRQIEERDIDRLVVAMNTARVETVCRKPARGLRRTALEPLVRQVIEHCLPHRVAVEHGEIIGWCSIVPQTNEHGGHVGELNIGVIPSARGRGVGSCLLASCLAGARQFGFEKLELQVNNDNHTAIRLYQRHHFSVEGVRRRAHKLQDSYQDVVHMARFTGLA